MWCRYTLESLAALSKQHFEDDTAAVQNYKFTYDAEKGPESLKPGHAELLQTSLEGLNGTSRAAGLCCGCQVPSLCSSFPLLKLVHILYLVASQSPKCAVNYRAKNRCQGAEAFYCSGE